MLAFMHLCQVLNAVDMSMWCFQCALTNHVQIHIINTIAEYFLLKSPVQPNKVSKAWVEIAGVSFHSRP